MNSIVTFGSGAAEQISKASDELLRGMNMSQVNDSNALMGALGRIMAEFDPDELEEKPSLLGKLFGDPRKKLEKVLDKYHTLGDEVDRVYIELRKYEEEIRQSNRQLEKMFQANVDSFHELEKYIVAGEQGCAEIRAYMDELRAKQAQTGDPAIGFELSTLQNALNMLEQRTHDLKLAEAVAMQSIPMIKTMQFSNMNLVRKINSAFIITLPVFKQALAQAIMLKRQRIQAEAMSALDEKTNEMLLKNAQNTAAQAVMTTRLASGNSIKIETLESSWQTIMKGIEETRQIQETAKRQRNEDQVRLERIKEEFNKNYHMPAKK